METESNKIVMDAVGNNRHFEKYLGVEGPISGERKGSAIRLTCDHSVGCNLLLALPTMFQLVSPYRLEIPSVGLVGGPPTIFLSKAEEVKEQILFENSAASPGFVSLDDESKFPIERLRRLAEDHDVTLDRRWGRKRVAKELENHLSMDVLVKLR